jgi:hypothetical protein
MMISLGYSFDQVSRERMVQRISQRTQLIAASTPTDAPVQRGNTLAISTAHPVYHELEITWTVGEREVASAKNRTFLALTPELVPAGEQQVTVTVVDPTPWVRDPAIRAQALTATRTWTVSSGPAPQPSGRLDFIFQPRLAGSTQTTRPIGTNDVVYIEFTRPDSAMAMMTPSTTWRVDGRVVPEFANRASVSLDSLRLSPGTHRLEVTTFQAPDGRTGAASETRSWTIDATPPTVTFALSATPAAGGTTDEPHFQATEAFTMKLEPKDDQPGYLVAEFRVNGDGWHHYYGWPDAPPGTPFKFTPRGTNIKELIYGSLSSEGLSPQPWEPREPGYGTHRIEYRAIDAAGNVGPVKAFRVTVTRGGS